MNKKLKFSPKLVKPIIIGDKVSTWRLWDNKKLSVGDKVDFINSATGKMFAKTKLIKIIEKPFRKMTRKDKSGHETFSSELDMYKTYSEYYGKQVNQHTTVKIIWLS